MAWRTTLSHGIPVAGQRHALQLYTAASLPSSTGCPGGCIIGLACCKTLYNYYLIANSDACAHVAARIVSVFLRCNFLVVVPTPSQAQTLRQQPAAQVCKHVAQAYPSIDARVASMRWRSSIGTRDLKARPVSETGSPDGSRFHGVLDGSAKARTAYPRWAQRA